MREMPRDRMLELERHPCGPHAARTCKAHHELYVVTCRYGSKLVEACAAAGTDYCDITGEIGWVREMIEKHDARAKQTGARIVHLCGHDSVPWDLSTLMLSKKLCEKGDQITRVDMYDDIKSGPSGGTLETAFGIMFGKDKAKAKSELPFDPLLKDGEGASACTTQARNVGSFELGKKGMPHRGLFFMAGVNANAVKRSNALNKYTEKLVYSEGEAFSSIFPLVLRLLGYVWFGLAVAIGPVRNMMLSSGMLPKPGEGPSQEAMLAGHLTVTGIARGSNGLKAKSVLTFPVDPGYMDTARMAVESGLALSLDGAKIPATGGVFTPAACQGEVLLERLLNTGSTFSCE